MSLLHTDPAPLELMLRRFFRVGDHGRGLQDCYVNYSSAITSTSKHFPAQKYLSARNSGTVETLSAARNRSAKTLSRTVRQVTAHLFSDSPSAGQYALSGLFLAQKIPSHRLCGIIITNYIHRQDGQK